MSKPTKAWLSLGPDGLKVEHGPPASLLFTVPGEPQAKERARVFGFKKASGVGVRGVTPKRTRAYAEVVRSAAMAAVSSAGWEFGEDEYYSVTIAVYRTHFRKSGDLDNYVKAVLDAMNGAVFDDDRYVRKLAAALLQDRENPRVEVTVEKMVGVVALARRRA